MLAIVVTITVKADKVDEFETVCRQLEQSVAEKEPGCLVYRMAKSRTDPLTYRNIEIFRDQEAMDFHLQADHFKTSTPKMGACLSGPAIIEFMDTVA